MKVSKETLDVLQFLIPFNVMIVNIVHVRKNKKICFTNIKIMASKINGELDRGPCGGGWANGEVSWQENTALCAHFNANCK